MIEMNQIEATKLLHRTETLQAQIADVMKKLVVSEEQFLEAVSQPNGLIEQSNSDLLTDIDNSVRIHVGSIISMFLNMLQVELGFLEQVRIQCTEVHGAIPLETSRMQ